MMGHNHVFIYNVNVGSPLRSPCVHSVVYQWIHPSLALSKSVQSAVNREKDFFYTVSENWIPVSRPMKTLHRFIQRLLWNRCPIRILFSWTNGKFTYSYRNILTRSSFTLSLLCDSAKENCIDPRIWIYLLQIKVFMSPAHIITNAFNCVKYL